jgi:hypothetical protein
MDTKNRNKTYIDVNFDIATMQLLTYELWMNRSESQKKNIMVKEGWGMERERRQDEGKMRSW